MISADAGFLFKGSGVYTTDYRSKPGKKDTAQEGSGATPLPGSVPAASRSLIRMSPIGPIGPEVDLAAIGPAAAEGTNPVG